MEKLSIWALAAAQLDTGKEQENKHLVERHLAVGYDILSLRCALQPPLPCPVCVQMSFVSCTAAYQQQDPVSSYPSLQGPTGLHLNLHSPMASAVSPDALSCMHIYIVDLFIYIFYIYIYMCVCIYKYTYIYIYTMVLYIILWG